MKIKFKTTDYYNIAKHPIMGSSIHNWIKLLYKNKFNIHVGFIPKVLFLTGNIVINIPFHLYEFLRYSKTIKQQKVVSPVFILGHFRSGTTYLHYVLCKDKTFSYCSTYEALTPHVFLTSKNVLKNILAKSIPETRPQDNMKMSIDSPKEEEFAMANMSQTSYQHGFYFPKRINENFEECVIFSKDYKKSSSHWKKHFDYFLKKLVYKHQNENLLMKSPANTARVKEILELYPDAKFIHIYRNPYDVYSSSYGLYEKILPVTSFQEIDDNSIEDFIIDSYELMYKKYLKEKGLIPSNQLFELSYEDFVNNPIEMIQKVYNHLGIGSFEESKKMIEDEINSTSSYRKNIHASIEKDVREKINKRWKFAFDAFGYNIAEN